ncbi:hypothetical protein ARMSODRAFT_59540 [Armillaria solidipes]|uniref:Uncharacterized protein n=1 Tax=Armillaria solidipes TaxID=1076256 RepID=A0A2H3CQ51_9AGAR|nr:hypothetical protein ARMSODRAFT_59540 [Armillaria solidipes]
MFKNFHHSDLIYVDVVSKVQICLKRYYGFSLHLGPHSRGSVWPIVELLLRNRYPSFKCLFQGGNSLAGTLTSLMSARVVVVLALASGRVPTFESSGGIQQTLSAKRSPDGDDRIASQIHHQLQRLRSKHLVCRGRRGALSSAYGSVVISVFFSYTAFTVQLQSLIVQTYDVR